jgi:uncharacterized membrane protein YkvA (DUF1232 family)
MDSLFSTIRFLFGCGTILVLALIALAHLPKSPLRSLLVQICGWAAAVICGAYVINPVDVAPEMILGPFGLVDDIIAVIVAWISARAAIRAGEERHTGKDTIPKSAE